MIVDIHSQALQAGRFAQNDLHRAHGLFACFNILFRGAFVGTQPVIRLDLPDLFFIQQHLGNTRVIFDGNGQPVGYRLIHGITVDLRTEGLIGLVDRCAGKTDKGCAGESLPENLRIGLGQHRFHVIVFVLAELDPFRPRQLRPMRLV